MEIGKQGSPRWLEPWLQLPFYEEKCKKHAKYNTVYCGVCMAKPVCEICWKYKSKEHEDHHEILQVRIASRRAAVGIHDIGKLLDISNIQQYVINGKDIVFLNPHREGVPNPHRKGNCKICKRRLIDHTYTFCSIACKKISMGGDMKIEKETEIQKQPQRQPKLKRKMMNMMNAECLPLRKRSRKGSPRRAPLK